ECEHREPRLLLCRSGRLLQLRNDLLDRGSVLQPARVRRDGEEVLREPVVDLPRHACALVGDGPAELRRANGAPHADEQDRVAEHAAEVATRETARGEWREQVAEGGEEA